MIAWAVSRIGARLTVRQLEYVVAVTDHRSFRRAAAAIGVSQPALSVQIQQVERELGVQLFERDRRSVLVTAAGAEVAAAARQALAAVDGVHDAARGRGEPLVGSLHVGVIPTIAPYLLPAVLPAVRRRFPRLELVLREDQTARILAQLHGGQLDLCLLALPVPGDVTTMALAHEPFLLAVPPSSPLARRKRVGHEVLAGERVLLLEDGHCLRDQALAVCQQAHASERVEVQATSLPTLIQMVAGGLGVTLLPASAAAILARGRPKPVALVPFDPPPPGRTLGLAWRTSSARLREFRLLGELLAGEVERVLP